MMENLETFEQKVSLAEKQLSQGKELTKEQYRELTKIALTLVKNASGKGRELEKRIIRAKNNHHTVRNANYIRELEEEHEKLSKEYSSPATSQKRKKQLAKRLKRISDTLQCLTR